MDEMTKPLDRGVWWIEYALRYPGLKHMKSPVHDLTFVQFYLLDVFAFLFIILFTILYTFVLCCKCCCGKKGSKSKIE